MFIEHGLHNFVSNEDNFIWPSRHWTIYSATTNLKMCRKVVLEKWFFKLGFFFLVNHFSPTRKNVDLWYKTIWSQLSIQSFFTMYIYDHTNKNVYTCICNVHSFWQQNMVGIFNRTLQNRIQLPLILCVCIS